MSMNFSSSIISGIGISLGGIDTTIDLLYSNAELYDTEINDIKQKSLNTKPGITKNITINRPVKPKMSRESIIKKYKLQVLNESVHEDEEIIDIGFVDDTEDFDASFDALDPEVTDEDAEANDLLLRLTQAGQEIMLNNNIEDESEEDAIEIEDDIDNIDIETDGLEDNTDVDGDSTYLDDIDNIDVEEDTIDIDNDIDIDDSTDDEEGFTLDELDEEPKEQSVKQQETVNQQTIKDVKPEEDDLEIDGLDEDSFELDEDQDESGENQDESGEDPDESDGFSLDELDDADIDVEDEESEPIKQNNIQNQNSINNTNKDIESIAKSVSNSIFNSTPTNNDNAKTSAEIDKINQRVAAIEKQLHNSNNTNASNKALSLYDDKLKNNDVDDIDKLISNAKGNSTNNNAPSMSAYEIYGSMSDESLYKEVSKFMDALGVRHRAVDIQKLNEKFGTKNVKRLLNKAYIINTGKGCTKGLRI